ncbi:hypothetical protein BGZ94_002808 [Podila epigama]|nr:hypothetical protein BGZ94_002808 [Podila epigama]
MARSELNQTYTSTTSTNTNINNSSSNSSSNSNNNSNSNAITYSSLEDDLAALLRSSSPQDGSIDPAGSDCDESVDQDDHSSILTRLLHQRDLIPAIIGYLDCRSLIALTSVSTVYRREILLPATPNLSCLNIFLQLRTIVCPMAQFEALKDFMIKYRAFKPVHIHFTYSEHSSLMSLLPVATVPIYSSKNDASLSHPSTSPLSSSHLFGVNQSISISFTSNSNSLYQHHHPLIPPASTSTSTSSSSTTTTPSSSSSSSSSHTLLQQHHRSNILLDTHRDIDPLETQSSQSCHSSSTVIHSQTDDNIHNCSSSNCHSRSSSSNSTLDHKSDHPRHQGLDKDQETNNGQSVDQIDASLAVISLHQGTGYEVAQVNASSSGASINIPTVMASTSYDAYDNNTIHNHSSFHRHHNNSGNAYNITHAHRKMMDMHSAPSESIPVLSSESSSTRPLINHGHHGFELSYWQKFALNELFMRLLPFLRTLTIGRTDKPSKSQRDIDPVGVELSAGVCFFLARCFNVMHDMPDTALESVLWMDVTSREVVLLITMIELRDIMVDDRYWKRGYWIVDHPCETDEDDLEQDYENHGHDTMTSDVSDDVGDWDGFYYLINQEGQENRAVPKPSVKLPMSHSRQQQPRSRFSSLRHRVSARKTNLNNSTFTTTAAAPTTTMTPTVPQPVQALANNESEKASPSSLPLSSNAPMTGDTSEVAESAAFPKRSVVPLPSEQKMSGLGHLVKSGASTSATNNNNDSHYYSRSSAHGRQRYRTEPAAWHGFGDDVPTNTGGSSRGQDTMNGNAGTGVGAHSFDFNETTTRTDVIDLHPAVRLFESLKEEILEAACSRSLMPGQDEEMMVATKTMKYSHSSTVK